MGSEAIQMQVRGAPVDWVSGILDQPDGAGTADGHGTQTVILLAHGAGVGMHSPFMSGIAEGLCAAGYPVLRFQYAYAERMQQEGKRRPPDRQPILEAVHRCAAQYLRERFPKAQIVLAGKSMGARMSSYLAAAGEPMLGLCFFGYPLHPPGKPDKQRVDQFPSITQPSLFLQGTRDALCDLELLEPALANYAGPVTLEILEGADHSFHVLKKSGTTDEATFADLLARTTRWLGGLAPGSVSGSSQGNPVEGESSASTSASSSAASPELGSADSGSPATEI